MIALTREGLSGFHRRRENSRLSSAGVDCQHIEGTTTRVEEEPEEKRGYSLFKRRWKPRV